MLGRFHGLRCAYTARILVFRGVLAILAIGVCGASAFAQNADLSGVVRDAQDAVVVGAELRLHDLSKGTVLTTKANSDGAYFFRSIAPSIYRLEVSAQGFSPAVRDALIVNIDQRLVIDVSLLVEGVTEAVHVSTARSTLSTTDGSVSTVIDRRFANDLPVRGRSLSALVGLSPGVNLLGASTSGSGSEFSVNGQRNTSNSLTVDGVSGLSEMDSGGFTNAAGQRLTSTFTGTVGGGISMDALQEIRIQTSTFAAEFGRTPGAQISVVTRSGANLLHGSLSEQYRDDAMMASDWFTNSRGLPQAKLEEHQFGGAFGGPIVRNRTFFFASYEGLRLTQPTAIQTSVPSIEARQQPSRAQALLNAYPAPTGPSRPDLTAEYVAAHSARNTSDTLGVRVDHVLSAGTRLFGRYAHVPSSSENNYPLQQVKSLDKLARSLTAGLTATMGARTLVELRALYGDSDYGTAANETPALRDWFPSSTDSSTPAWRRIQIPGLATIFDGSNNYNVQDQGGLNGSVSYVAGVHLLKAGVDYRRLRPSLRRTYETTANMANVAQLIADRSTNTVAVARQFPLTATFENLSVYAQDTWKTLANLTLTYGLRWDLNPAPSFSNGEGPLAVSTFEPIQSLKLTSAPGEPLWRTNLTNLYPRFGFSYAFGRGGLYVVSGGAGIFGDLEGPAASTNVGGRTDQSRSNVPLPLTATDVRGVETPIVAPPYSTIVVVDPHLATPRTAQWNLSLERSLGDNQTVAVTYVGARGDDLLQTQLYSPGLNADFPSLVLVRTASGESRFQSLQLQYRRRSASGLQVLASYVLGDARDTTSAIGAFDRSGGLAPAQDDLRHSAKVAMSWTLPSVRSGPAAWLLRDWNLHAIGTARSGYPFSVLASTLSVPGQEQFQRRASQVPGVEVLIDDPTAPGGRRFNPAAFVDPPAGQQGDTDRNAFRTFSAAQLDMSLQRAIRLPYSSSLSFRVDVFNVFNTPVFSYPNFTLSSATFGIVQTTQNGSGTTSYYRAGGARSAALSLRFEF